MHIALIGILVFEKYATFPTHATSVHTRVNAFSLWSFLLPELVRNGEPASRPAGVELMPAHPPGNRCIANTRARGSSYDIDRGLPDGKQIQSSVVLDNPDTAVWIPGYKLPDTLR
jgi:hypothetical protein